MSGHSKWSTIKRQKGAADAKRGQIFTKLSNAITIAVRQGGGIADPESNFKLRLVMDQARAANMPKDNIERAIKRAEGKQEGDLTEVMYEGFAPGGVALLVEAVTDKKQRTVAEVKNVLERSGGRLGDPGSVSYLFAQKGFISLNKNGKSMDEILGAVLEAGGEDLEEMDDGSITIYTSSTELKTVQKALQDLGFTIESAEIGYKPVAAITPNQDSTSKIHSLIEKLEELDDVQAVYTNTTV